MSEEHGVQACPLQLLTSLFQAPATIPMHSSNEYQIGHRLREHLSPREDLTYDITLPQAPSGATVICDNGFTPISLIEYIDNDTAIHGSEMGVVGRRGADGVSFNLALVQSLQGMQLLQLSAALDEEET